MFCLVYQQKLRMKFVAWGEGSVVANMLQSDTIIPPNSPPPLPPPPPEAINRIIIIYYYIIILYNLLLTKRCFIFML